MKNLLPIFLMTAIWMNVPEKNLAWGFLGVTAIIVYSVLLWKFSPQTPSYTWKITAIIVLSVVGMFCILGIVWPLMFHAEHMPDFLKNLLENLFTHILNIVDIILSSLGE